MKKKIGNLILVIIFCFIIINSIISYVSYKTVCNNNEPRINFGIVRKTNETIYKQLLYKITVKKVKDIRTVSLKLFFIN